MSPRPPPRVLVVDDEPLMRRAVRNTLTACGFQVGDCSDTHLALLLHARHRFDAVLFECHAPPHTPETFVRTLRARGDDVVLIACCASAATPYRASLLAAGIDAFVPKVDLYRDLRAVIEEHLARRRAT